VHPRLKLFLILWYAHIVVPLYLRNQLERRSHLPGICSQRLRGGVSDEKSVIRGLRFGEEISEKVELRFDESHV
jgi:hypothetical protein